MEFTSSRAGVLGKASLAAALLMVAGCGSKAGDAKVASTADGGASPASAPAGPSACTLLTMEEAKAAYPKVVSATAVQFAGENTTACDWKSETGGLYINVEVTPLKVADELNQFKMSVQDPGKQASVPVDTIKDVQVEVATRKSNPGILFSLGAAAMQKGGKTIAVSSRYVDGDVKSVEERLVNLVKLAASRVS